MRTSHRWALRLAVGMLLCATVAVCSAAESGATGSAKSIQKSETRVYDVRDIVFDVPRVVADDDDRPAAPNERDVRECQERAETLVGLLWDTLELEQALAQKDSPGNLVIVARPSQHETVERILQEMRRARSSVVDLDVHVFVLDRKALAKELSASPAVCLGRIMTDLLGRPAQSVQVNATSTRAMATMTKPTGGARTATLDATKLEKAALWHHRSKAYSQQGRLVRLKGIEGASIDAAPFNAMQSVFVRMSVAAGQSKLPIYDVAVTLRDNETVLVLEDGPLAPLLAGIWADGKTKAENVVVLFVLTPRCLVVEEEKVQHVK